MILTGGIGGGEGRRSLRSRGMVGVGGKMKARGGRELQRHRAATPQGGWEGLGNAECSESRGGRSELGVIEVSRTSQDVDRS